MGLDNSIRLRVNSLIDQENWKIWPDYITVERNEFAEKEYKDGFYYDVCCWRKCWCLRDDILNELNIKNSPGGRFEIDKPQQIRHIINLVEFYLENPEEWRPSIWDISEMIPHLGQNIVDLSWLADFMEKNMSAYVEFVDSY